METEETFEFDIAEFIRATARRQATGVMDPEDLEQDLWVFYLEELAGSDYPPGTINDLIKRRAAKIDRQERIDYMHFRGSFIYTPSMVRTLLSDAVWCEAEDSFDIEGRVDVTRALRELPARDQHRLFCWFGCGERNDSPTDKKTISRLVDRIADTLNLRSGMERADESHIVAPSTLKGASF